MKIERSKSKSGLFLIELIIAIVFFAVASAVCIQLFVQAFLTSDRSSDLGAASILAQNYAEEYKLKTYKEKTSIRQENDQRSILLYYGYNAEGDLVELPEGDEDARYVLSLGFQDEFDPVLSARISVYKWNGSLPEAALCALDIKCYDPESAL